MPPYFHKPEYALKRANEFINVGKKGAALELLHDVLSSKRHKTWTKVSEQIMLLFLRLCVDMRRGKTAKDGLHQYKNICQQVGIGSLESVIRQFLAMAEAKAEEAREKANQVAGAALEQVDDLDATETPESLILSTVTGEDTQDRTDREVLTPWLKFLWESYRTVLEILRNNARLEHLYQEVAQSTFKFCLNYTRKTEFRRLCDLLRTHLANAQKYSNSANSVNLNNPETLQLQLEIRFAQLEAAAKLDLWQESFRTIEDIHGLMGLSKKPPKPQMMAIYFEQLSVIFWKSENYLFHAYACHKLFWLSKEQKKTLTEEEASRLATRCVLATLLVPVKAKPMADEESLEIDNVFAKQQQQAIIVGLSQPPTSASLIADLRSKNVLQYVPEDIRSLFNWLEDTFHPLDMCRRVAEVLVRLEANEEWSCYVKPLQRVTMTRLLLQLSRIYQVMSMDFLCALAPFFTRTEIEKFLVDTVRQKVVQVRMCHGKNSISFGTDAFYASEAAADECDGLADVPHGTYLKGVLSSMSKVLSVSVKKIHGDDQAKALHKAKALRQLATMVGNEHKLTLERKMVIENRKVRLEEAIQRKTKQQAEQRAQQRAIEMQKEKERLEAESKRRMLEQKQREREELEKQLAMKKVEAMQRALPGSKLLANVKAEELADMGAEEILAKQVQQLGKEKRELEQKLKQAERKFDHMERAKAIEEVPLRLAAREEFRAKEKLHDEAMRVQELERARAQHAKDLEQKERVGKIAEAQAQFIAQVRERREEEYAAKLDEFEEHIQAVLVQHRQQRRERKALEAEARAAEEERMREEEERMEQERQQQQAEEERREKLRMEREAQAQHLEEIRKKQLEKEREIEERLQRKKAEAVRPPPEAAALPADSWRSRAPEAGVPGPIQDDVPAEPERQPAAPLAWRSARVAAQAAGTREAPMSRDRFESSRDRVDSGRDRFGSSRDRNDVSRDRPESGRGRFESSRDRYESSHDRFGSGRERPEPRRERADQPQEEPRGNWRAAAKPTGGDVPSWGDDRRRSDFGQRGERDVGGDRRDQQTEQRAGGDGWQTQSSRNRRRSGRDGMAG